MVISVGTTAHQVNEALAAFPEGSVGHADLGFIKPLDTQNLEEIFSQYKAVLTVEDGALKGGAGESIMAFAQQKNYRGKIFSLGIEDAFVPHGQLEKIHDIAGISPQRIRAQIEAMITEK